MIQNLAVYLTDDRVEWKAALPGSTANGGFMKKATQVEWPSDAGNVRINLMQGVELKSHLQGLSGFLSQSTPNPELAEKALVFISKVSLCLGVVLDEPIAEDSPILQRLKNVAGVHGGAIFVHDSLLKDGNYIAGHLSAQGAEVNEGEPFDISPDAVKVAVEPESVEASTPVDEAQIDELADVADPVASVPEVETIAVAEEVVVEPVLEPTPEAVPPAPVGDTPPPPAAPAPAPAAATPPPPAAPVSVPANVPAPPAPPVTAPEVVPAAAAVATVQLDPAEMQYTNENPPAIRTTRRERTLAHLAERGFSCAASLPIGETEPELRPTEQIAARLGAAAVAYLWCLAPASFVSDEELQSMARTPDVAGGHTAKTVEVLSTERSEAAQKYSNTIGWSLENMWSLAWVLGFEHDLKIDSGMIDEEPSIALRDWMPIHGRTMTSITAAATPRQSGEVADKEDIFYCAHNSVRSAQLGEAETVPDSFDPMVDGGTVHERRHGLTWALSAGVPWDETDLST